MKQIKILALSLLLVVAARAQDHGHLNVGADGQTPGAALRFDNGADFATDTRYVKTMNFATSGKYTGYYEGNISLTVLHSVDPFGEPDPTAPAPGAFILAEIVSVDGPAGGEFGFWDRTSTTAPTHSIPVGTSNGTFQFEISDAALGAGEPGGDAYGHIHGRRFTTTHPGLYTVGFRAIDTSTHGEAGAPIHTPSEVLLIQFQAGVNLLDVERIEGANIITAALPANYAWQLEAKDTLNAPEWTPIEAPVPGHDQIAEIHDSSPGHPNRFYRLTGTPVAP